MCPMQYSPEIMRDILILEIIYLELQFNWAFCLLSGKSVSNPLHPSDSKFLQGPESEGLLGPLAGELPTPQEQHSLWALQAFGLSPQREIILDKTSCPNVFFGFPRMGPLAPSECQLSLRIKLSFKKRKKIKSNKECTVSQSELHKCTHLAHRSNWASRFVLLKRKLASLALKQPHSWEINTEDAKS